MSQVLQAPRERGDYVGTRTNHQVVVEGVTVERMHVEDMVYTARGGSVLRDGWHDVIRYEVHVGVRLDVIWDLNA